MQQVWNRSRHFQLEQLADGVYGAFGHEGAGTMANAGIVDLGGETLVFDTFFTPQAGADLRRAAEELTGRPVSLVVNSHWHADHTFGNQAFAGTFVAATRTAELMATRLAVNWPPRWAISGS